MKFFTAAMLAMIGNFALHAQNKVACEFEITYSVHYQSFKNEKEPNEDLMILQVGKGGQSEFHSYWNERNKAIMDSLMSMSSNPIEAIQQRQKQGMPNGQSYKVYKNLPEQGSLTYEDNIVETMFYEEPMPAINWQMEEGDSTIAGYACQKAVGEWKGRKWTAWFAMDIPVSDGPWKLCGLPGLILKASEGEGCFDFTCVGITKTTDKSFDFTTKGKTKATQKKMLQLRDMAVNDPKELIKNTLGLDPGEIIDMDGNPFIPEKKEMNYIEIIE